MISFKIKDLKAKSYCQFYAIFKATQFSGTENKEIATQNQYSKISNKKQTKTTQNH